MTGLEKSGILVEDLPEEEFLEKGEKVMLKPKTRFCRLSIDNLHYSNEDDNWVQDNYGMFCNDKLSSLFDINKKETLEICFSCRPMCKDSIAISLERESWYWVFYIGYSTEGSIFSLFLKISRLLDNYFGEENQLIHGYLTVYGVEKTNE